MARFVVAKGGMLSDETIEADRMGVSRDGSLLFYRYSGPDVGRDTRPVELVQAFAPGRWVEVLRLGHLCAALPRHVHNANGEPVYTP